MKTWPHRAARCKSCATRSTSKHEGTRHRAGCLFVVAAFSLSLRVHWLPKTIERRLIAVDCRMQGMPLLEQTKNNAAAFHVVNLGCKVNRVESDDFAATLIADGGREVPIEAADFIVVNTCTVTGEAEKKTRKAVRQALRANDFARVVVTGCAAAIDPITYTEMDPRVEVVPKGAMADVLGSQASTSPALAAIRAGEEFPTRVGVKVQDGCNNACTYCIVHVARGRAASRPSEEIIAEVRELARAGVREIVLTGINLGSYREGDMRLADLLRCLMKAVDEEFPADSGLGVVPRVRFRVSSIEPRDVDDDLIELMAASNGRICRHLHLPLQSGSSKVLREMRRPYSAERFLGLVEKLYAAMPQLSLSTDVIVGFPGETEEDFLETCRVAEACRFSKMHIFRYSKRAGTPAAERDDQVSPEVKAERAKRLEAIEERLRADDMRRRCGSRELALVESEGNATTESYHGIDAPAGSAVGDLVECEL